MSNEPTHDISVVEQPPISDYAPRRNGNGAAADGDANGKTYLTEAMISAPANVHTADPIRLSQITGPAIDKIGKTTADKIELSALALVENARSGAETIIAEAQAQASDMIAGAETQAAEMREFAKVIRAYTDRKAAQVSEFCAAAESIMTTMHALGSNFQSMIAAESVADREDKENLLPTSLNFLNRKVAIK